MTSDRQAQILHRMLAAFEIDHAQQPAPKDPASPGHALAAIGDTIGRALGHSFRLQFAQPVQGGHTHHAYIVSNGRLRFFVKLAGATQAPMLEAERDGLTALRIAGVRAPEPIGQGIGGGFAHLVLEYLDLRRPEGDDFVRLGRALAGLHSHVGTQFGWPRANFIGASEQTNTPGTGWARFFARDRLAPQLKRAARLKHGGLLQSLGERVVEAVPRILAGHQPTPALVHGDLWQGNVGVVGATPVFFDPAIHYADREVEIAMTELFGGFPHAFYAAYHERLPLDGGYARRRELYNLYHILNHLNIFGGSYREQAEIRMRELLSRL